MGKDPTANAEAFVGGRFLDLQRGPVDKHVGLFHRLERDQNHARRLLKEEINIRIKGEKKKKEREKKDKREAFAFGARSCVRGVRDDRKSS